VRRGLLHHGHQLQHHGGRGVHRHGEVASVRWWWTALATRIG
jgi:hypothetical protein